jgi:6-phosphogluconate dehydrogenase (decarboxylating)
MALSCAWSAAGSTVVWVFTSALSGGLPAFKIHLEQVAFLWKQTTVLDSYFQMLWLTDALKSSSAILSTHCGGLIVCAGQSQWMPGLQIS